MINTFEDLIGFRNSLLPTPDFLNSLPACSTIVLLIELKCFNKFLFKCPFVSVFCNPTT